MTDSLGELGARPISITSCLLAASPQLSFVAIVPLASCNSRVGFATAPGRPLEGPIARTANRFEAEPRMMKPAMSALSPVPTCIRVERFTARRSDDVHREHLRTCRTVYIGRCDGDVRSANRIGSDQQL